MKYPFSVFLTQVDTHTFWIAKSTALKGCVGQGDTQQEAIQELEINETIWLETAQEVGIPIPVIPIEEVQEYSGKLTLRIAPSVHRKAALMAKKDGISLNQYINDAIVAHNSEISTGNYISEYVAGVLEQLNERFFPCKSSSCDETQYFLPFNRGNVYCTNSVIS